MKCAMTVVCLCFAMGCGGSPAIDAAPAAPSPQQVAAEAEIAKQRNEIAEERASLEMERQAFRAEQQTADQRAVARTEQIRAATAEYEAAEMRQEERRKAADKAFAESEARRKYQEDLVRLGSLKTSEKLWIQTAVAMFNKGDATAEQLQMLLPFNEYRDAVLDELARRGAGAGVLTPPSDTKPSEASRKAFEEMKNSK